MNAATFEEELTACDNEWKKILSSPDPPRSPIRLVPLPKKKKKNKKTK